MSVPVADLLKITGTKPREQAVCLNADMHKHGKKIVLPGDISMPPNPGFPVPDVNGQTKSVILVLSKAVSLAHIVTKQTHSF